MASPLRRLDFTQQQGRGSRKRESAGDIRNRAGLNLAAKAPFVTVQRDLPAATSRWPGELGFAPCDPLGPDETDNEQPVAARLMPAQTDFIDPYFFCRPLVSRRILKMTFQRAQL